MFLIFIVALFIINDCFLRGKLTLCHRILMRTLFFVNGTRSVAYQSSKGKFHIDSTKKLTDLWLLLHLVSDTVNIPRGTSCEIDLSQVVYLSGDRELSLCFVKSPSYTFYYWRVELTLKLQMKFTAGKTHFDASGWVQHIVRLRVWNLLLYQVVLESTKRGHPLLPQLLVSLYSDNLFFAVVNGCVDVYENQGKYDLLSSSSLDCWRGVKLRAFLRLA